MKKTIIFISDYFIDEIVGGAELCNDALIENYLKLKYEVIKIKSVYVNLNFINLHKNNVFIIANYMQLSENVKSSLANNMFKYIIYEHDHKYLKSNNPAIYNNFLANEEQIQNINFCKNAVAVLCQSSLHSEIVFKNTLLKNIVNLGCNIWSEKHLKILGNNIKPNELKNIDNIVYNSKNYNKGTFKSIEYCQKNNINFQFLENCEYEQFIENLSKAKNLIFFPTWIETFNRLAVEAKILECKITTNKFIGAASENLLSLSGLSLLNEIKLKMNKVYNIFNLLITNDLQNINFYSESLPRVTIMCTFVEAELYIEQYLEQIINQTIFNEIDLFIVDCASTGKEQEIINNYIKKYKNINYIRLENKVNISTSFNLILDNTNNKYISMIQVDDRPSLDYCETLRKHLHYSNEIDLVYGDCLQTNKPNETFNNNSSNMLYDHSIMDFKKENMIKCLPGPMPMFKKFMLEKNGKFDTDLIYANDWELWLRCIRNGSVFKKINKQVGLYYFNPNGKSTSLENLNNKLKEERKIFNEYIDVLGPTNYNLYKDYFNREV